MALMLAAGLVSGAANATFIDQGGGVIPDTVTNLEWEQNAGHGSFNWAGAVAYGTGLALDGGGWHLATIGELQALYNDLSAQTRCGDCTGNEGPFTRIQPDYWSGTELIPGLNAWNFSFVDGDQVVVKGVGLSAWAVRPGDVAAAPEPASLLLIGAGMLGLGWSRRRGRRR